jgi:hypothetical protein
MNLPASSGVVMKGSNAWPWNFSITSFDLSTSRSAAFRRATMAGGVFAGASSACHCENWNS